MATLVSVQQNSNAKKFKKENFILLIIIIIQNYLIFAMNDV